MTKISPRAPPEETLSEEEIRELIEIMGGPEQISRDLEQLRRNRKALSVMLAELLRKHPNRWVAVYGGKVVGTSKKREWLRWRLRRRGINPNLARIVYLDTDRRPVILLREAA